jgi:hypothetical protein
MKKHTPRNGPTTTLDFTRKKMKILRLISEVRNPLDIMVRKEASSERDAIKK